MNADSLVREEIVVDLRVVWNFGFGCVWNEDAMGEVMSNGERVCTELIKDSIV